MTRFKRAISSAFLASVLVQAVAAHAATYHVATTGSDSTPCVQAQNADTPKLTISAGIKCLSASDTLIIKAGTYVNQEITNPPAGTASAYTVIKGDPGGARPVILPSKAKYQRGVNCSQGETCKYIEIRHLEFRDGHNAIKLSGDNTVGYPHHFRIIDNYIYGGGVGILIASSTTGYLGGDHLIQGNTFEQVGRLVPGYSPGINSIYNTGNRTIVEGNTFRHVVCGVAIYQSSKPIRDVIVRNNVFYDLWRPSLDPWQVGQGGPSAIMVGSGGGGHQIYNNVIYRSGEANAGATIFHGIRITPYSFPITIPIHIYNNTIYGALHSSAQGITITPTTGGPYDIRNNIVHLHGKIHGGTQSHNLTDDPSFMDPARANFALRSRSIAIDAGEILGIVATDFAGARRPAGSSHDIGAYEYNAGDENAPQAPNSLSVR